MTPRDLDAIEALAAAATPGPWRHGPLFWEVWQEGSDGSMTIRVAAVPQSEPGRGGIGRQREPDAAFIAALDPATVRELIAAARLGAAWQAAEAALPDGWRIDRLVHLLSGSTVTNVWSYGDWRVIVTGWAPDGSWDEMAEEHGPTPAAALLSLAEALRGRK